MVDTKHDLPDPDRPTDASEAGLRPRAHGPPKPAADRVFDRIIAGRWILGAAVLVFAALVAFGALAATSAALSMVVIFGVALLVPNRTSVTAPAGAAPVAPPDGPDISTRRFADTLREPCFIVDRRAHLLHANPAAIRSFPGAAVGDPLAFSLRHPAFLSTVDEAIRTQRRAEGDFSISVPTETWYRVEVTPLGTLGASPGGLMVVTLSNRSEQRRLDRMRADFIANASHELRTPLTSLIGFLDTLAGPAAHDSEAREKFLGIMRTQADRMARLIDDLLSLSRIELHQHMRPTGTANLGLIAAGVIELLQSQARETGVSIELQSTVHDPVVTGDRDELTQMIENLLDNAIKYGGDGGRISVSIGKATRPGADVELTIRDFGAGIAPELVPRLTERFYRVDAESSRRLKGTGLGLAIAKHIVTRHRGDLAITSELGKGTEVRVSLAR